MTFKNDDQDYISWKKWEEEKFIKCSDFEEKYFQAEIKKTKLNSIKHVIEIGFGNGNFLAYAKKQEWKTIGVEVNSDLVMRAKKFGVEAYIYEESFEIIKDQWADLVVAIDVFEHIEQNKLEELFSQIHRILKPSGAMLARFPNADSPLGLVNQNGDFTHITAIGSYKINYLAEKHGFSIKYIGEEAKPIFCSNIKFSIQRVIANPIIKILNKLLCLIFFPGNRSINYLSINLVVVLEKL